MKRKILAFLLAVLVVTSSFLLVGCGQKDSEAQVYFLNFKPESAAVYEELAKKYEEEKGVKVKVVTAAANTYEQTLKSEIAKTDAPTIFQVNGPIGYNSWKDYCLDIKESKLYSYLTDKSLAIKDGDGVYAVPYVVEGYGIIYNNAIMDKYFALDSRQKKVNSVKEINSFETLKTVVEDMTKHKKQLDIEGVFASTSLSSGEDWRWQTHLLNVPLYYEYRDDEKQSDPTLALLDAKEISFKYADNFKNIFDLYTDNSVTKKTLLGSKSVADSMAEFALSKVAMVQNGNWAWSQISGVEGNTVKAEDVKMMPIYSGIKGEERQGICIGTENYLAINKNVSEEKRKASLEFLDWLFSSKTGKQYVTEKLGFITPFNTFSDTERPNDPLAGEIHRYLTDENTETVPWIFTAFPSETFKKETGSALLDYVQGAKDFKAVADTVKTKWKSERK
ncbi:MAG: ABC transporter substrate-binding protein [Ruminococcaceae bacterium]|nr:ABC transporter substrate-binding protein [Oscillospiraceae bacterium]